MNAPQDIVNRLPFWHEIRFRATLKGWPMNDTNTWRAAENEALAEAGLAGFISNLPTGDHLCGKCRIFPRRP